MTLLVPVTPPATVTGTAAVSVDATWLVCQDNCLPGQATVKIDLPTAAPAGPAHAAEFAAARAAMPHVGTSDDLATVKVVRGRAAGVRRRAGNVEAGADRHRVDPRPMDGWDASVAKVTVDGPTSHARFTLTPQGDAKPPVETGGILAYSIDGQRTGVRCVVKVSAAAGGGTPP